MTHSNLESVQDELNQFSKLPDNWNLEGGRAPQKVDINNACEFTKLIDHLETPMPMVQSSSNGEISFVWRDRDSGVYIDIGFLDGGYSYYAVDESKSEFFQDNDSYQEDELKKLCRILGKKST